MTKEQLKQRLELNSAMTQIAADYLRENACAIEREMVESLWHSCGLSETDAVYTLFCIIAGLELDENPLSVVIENNNFESGSYNTGIIENDQYNQNTIHPLDKIMELNKQATDLFERMLAVEKEKSALLEQLLKEKGK